MSSCPKCGADGVPVAHGLPRSAALAAAQAGRIALGGCSIGPDEPLWRCSKCRAWFGRYDDEEDRRTAWAAIAREVGVFGNEADDANDDEAGR